MLSFPINTPTSFVNTLPTNEIDFQSGGPAGVVLNKALNFVVTTTGDMLYRATGAHNYLERLPIGTVGQFLTSNGATPVWTSFSSSSITFTSYVSSFVAGIPTSAATGATPGVWYPLNNSYVDWSTSFPGNNADGVFDTVTGLFTAPANGYYSFNCAVTFDSGAGVNGGAGLPASLPSGIAIRQVQLYTSSGGGAILATASRQVEASDFNSTVVTIASEVVLLTAGDTVGINVRHDRSGANTVTVGNPAISLPSQTYFSGTSV